MDAEQSSPMVRATAADLPVIARSLAKAFADDPVFAVLFGGSVPEPRATRFFEIMGAMQLKHGHVYRTPGSEAASVWAPPGEWKVRPKDIIKNSPGLIKVFGRRLIPNLKILDAMEKNHPNDLHYHLEFIGTDPAHQGKGLGTALLQPMVERCDREGVGAYLESSKESNIAFYNRFGFQVTKTLIHKPGVPMWLMWRDPK